MATGSDTKLNEMINIKMNNTAFESHSSGAE